MENHPLLVKELIAIGAIFILALVALLKDIDGVIFFTAIAAIAGIAGYTLRANIPQGIIDYFKSRIKKG